MRLANKVALITGSSRGIGKAVALAFAREGADLLLNYYAGSETGREEKNRRQAEETLAEVLASGNQVRPGMKAAMINADISRPEDVDRMFGEARRSLGPIDILVNNAGVYPRTPWLELDPQTFDNMIDVHLKGAYLCSRAVTPDLIEKGYGKIINVSSVTVHLGIHEGLAHYISAKAGVIGLTRALARELGKYNVQVNAISPGAIQVEMELEVEPDQAALATFLNERQCLKRRGTPEDMAGTYVFLASHESDFITGQLINVDGGWAMY
ncbi:MAG: 3-oxoacyl-ACP reductase FabG [Chloroflexi bacterium]|nr:3-oxoacyl-ACP reductase FabG [Chloroflexota bacterium]